LGGTSSKGMEFWNPHDGTIQLISDVHPLESATNSFERPKLVAIKGILLRHDESLNLKCLEQIRK